MTQEPEYIIGGTKVEVGQVYENEYGTQHIIQKITPTDIQPIFASGSTFSHIGVYAYNGEPCEHDLIKCVGRVVPLDNHDKKFKLGDNVTKTSGSKWSGKVVGFYSTKLTPVGYAVESFTEIGSVQIYPEKALTMIEEATEPRPDADGWVSWNGGECPVDGNPIVNTKRKDGIGTWTDFAGMLNWEHNCVDEDISTYRIVQTAQSEPEMVQENGTTPKHPMLYAQQPRNQNDVIRSPREQADYDQSYLAVLDKKSTTEQPKKLKLSAWELVQATIMLMSEDKKADATVYSVLAEIRNNPNLEEYLA